MSMIGLSLCQTFYDLIMVMRDANGVSAVKCENLVERCVRRPENKGMYEIQRNAGRFFLHEDLWDRWSRGLSFAKDVCFPKGGSCSKLSASSRS